MFGFAASVHGVVLIQQAYSCAACYPKHSLFDFEDRSSGPKGDFFGATSGDSILLQCQHQCCRFETEYRSGHTENYVFHYQKIQSIGFKCQNTIIIILKKNFTAINSLVLK